MHLVGTSSNQKEGDPKKAQSPQGQDSPGGFNLWWLTTSPQEEWEEEEEDIISYLLRDFVFHIFSLSVAAQDDLSEEATRQQQQLRKHKHYPSYGRLLQSPLLLLLLPGIKMIMMMTVI